MEAHQHDVIYYGVVNLVHQSKIIGTIDVWRCRSCSELFCEDKRFGATDLAPEVGFPSVKAGSKWAALICTRNTGSNWTLTAAKPGVTLAHSCTPETKLELIVGPDYSLEPGLVTGVGKHRIILIEDFVNTAVDVESGQKHTGTTDSYQALGKPFSFTPPLSAAVVQSSKLEFFNLASLLFLLSGIWTILAGSSLLAAYQMALALKAILAVLGIASLSAGYLIFRKNVIGPLLGLGVSFAGLLAYFGLRALSGTLGIPDYTLGVLFVVGIIVGWSSWSRIKSLKASQWHPLDMPAYG